ncbi:MAG TPA: tetratricopeptide repeat protein [Fimbriimonadaceae bacterium]|nr:tetratricopeptide repeat protein [Fimbriimonadaceae bacterium]HRJ96801.1 tetratricopeptide repeat protein [Fimbriimonadaceae bacterium]
MSVVSKWFGFGRDDDYDRGIAAFDRGQYEEAIAEFGACIERSRDPGTIRLAKFYICQSWSHLGQAALLSDSFARAFECFEAALEIQPHYPDLHLRASFACDGLGDRARRQAAIERALKINPNYAEALLQRGLMQYEDGEFDEGLASIEQAVETEPGFAGARYDFALECHRNGDTARALANFAAMTGADAQDANEHAKIGDAFARQALWEEAGQEYERALQIAPTYADVRCRYAQALLEVNNLEGAERQLRGALDVNPKYADAWAHLGVCLRRQRRLDDARFAFEKALEFDPHNVIARDEASRR